MTVSVSHRRKTFDGDDASTDFDVDFPIFSGDHVVAWDHDDTAETVAPLTKDVHFTISLDGDAPSTFNIDITLLHAGGLPSDHRLTVAREQVVTQSVQFQKGDAFPFDTVEKALDRSAMVAQDSKDRIDRALHAPDSDPETVDLEIDDAETRALGYQGYDSDGNATTFGAPAGTTSLSALAVQLVARATADLMRNDLNIESDTFANRPVTRVNGDIFIATDTQQAFIWDGGWKEIGLPQVPLAFNYCQNPEFLPFAFSGSDWEGPFEDEKCFVDRWWTIGDYASTILVSKLGDGPEGGPDHVIQLQGGANAIDKKFGCIHWLPHELARSLRNTICSLSFWEKASEDGNPMRLRAGVIRWSGTANQAPITPFSAWNGEGVTPTLKANCTLVAQTDQILPDETWTRHVLEGFTLASNTQQVGIAFWSDDGTSTTSTAQLQRYTGVQLELGASATAWRPRGTGSYAADCLGFRRRYYADSFAIKGYSAAAEVWTYALPLEPRMHATESPAFAPVVAEFGTFTKTNVASVTYTCAEPYNMLLIEITTSGAGAFVYEPQTGSEDNFLEVLREVVLPHV
jgi:hypothetical protein